jgi:hypothetical protein
VRRVEAARSARLSGLQVVGRARGCRRGRCGRRSARRGSSRGGRRRRRCGVALAASGDHAGEAEFAQVLAGGGDADPGAVGEGADVVGAVGNQPDEVQPDRTGSRPHTDAIRNSAVKSPNCANSSPPLTENFALPGVEHTNRPSSTCPSFGVANYRPGRPHAVGGRDWAVGRDEMALRAP